MRSPACGAETGRAAAARAAPARRLRRRRSGRSGDADAHRTAVRQRDRSGGDDHRQCDRSRSHAHCAADADGGGHGDAADWMTQGHVPEILDAAIAADAAAAAIVVSPDGTDGQWYDNIDGSLRNQTYALDYLIPYVDRHFRTIAGRAGRAIDGL